MSLRAIRCLSRYSIAAKKCFSASSYFLFSKRWNPYSKLKENYCDNGYYNYKEYLCPDGCENGACIKNETSLTKQDILDMLNKCTISHIYEESSYESCDDYCKNIGKTCISANKLQTDTLVTSDSINQGEYETKRYVFFEKSYNIDVIIISDTDKTVRFKINGETTPALREKDTYKFSDGVRIDIDKIIVNEGSEEAGADRVIFNLDKSIYDDLDFLPVECDSKFLTEPDYEIDRQQFICVCCSPY